MKIDIYVFSGTGNTAHVATLLCQSFREKGNECESIPLEEVTLGKRELREADLIGIGYPVHAFDAPQIVYDFVKLLPHKRQRYFLFKTAGDKFIWGGSSHALRLQIAQKGWKLEHESFYVMPANVFINPKPDKIKEIVEAAAEQVNITVSEILNGVRKLIPDTTIQRTLSLISLLEKRGCKKGSKNWQINENCTLCGLCAKQCPTGNISIEDGKLHFSDKCILCLRCWWNCPTRATSHRHLNVFLLKQPYRL